MQNNTAPYRADEVGSLLRTQPVKDARAKCEKGQMTPAETLVLTRHDIRTCSRCSTRTSATGSARCARTSTVHATWPRTH